MNDQCIIRKSRYRIFFYIIFSVAILFVICFKTDDDGKYYYENSPILTIIIGLVFLGLSLYFLNEFIKAEPEMILSEEGITFRYQGLYAWNMIHSIRSVQYENTESLFFQVYDESFEIDISLLEEDRKAIVDLILKYSTNPELHYTGHEIR